MGATAYRRPVNLENPSAVEPVESAAGTPSAPARSARATSLLPVGAMAVTVLLWASAFVAIRHLGRTVSPGALTLGRLTVGSLVLGAVLLTRREAWPRRADWPRLIAIGVLWFAVYNVALNAAEHRVDAGTAAMLVNVGPVLLALLAGMRLGEGFPRPLIVGSAIGFGGVVVIGVATSTGTRADVWGVVLCVVAAVAYAVAVILQKPVLARSSSLMVTWVACTVGVLVCLPFAPQLVSELTAGGPGPVGGVVYLGLGPTALGFTLWGYALARTNAGRLGATTYLVPPVAILLGWALLGEVPPVLALLGGALCLVGVWVTRRPSMPRPSASPGR